MGTAALEAFRSGYFREAAQLLKSNGRVEDQLLQLELDYFLGLSANVRSNGERILNGVNDPKLASRAATVLASQLSDDGSFARSLDLSQKAADFAQRAGDCRR